MEGQLGWCPVVDVDDGIDRWRKGQWTPQEDKLLIEHVNLHGEGRWNSVSGLTGLKRSGKSCRLRWVNYLRPDLKRSKITPHEETIILDLHARWGNRWSAIARSLPGRTDNEIKNYWRTHFKKSGGPTKKVDRARVNFLKQQQEQKQHFRRNEEHQQQQLHQEPQVEIDSAAQEMHDMPYLFQPGTDCGDSIEYELGTWGNLWNLDGDIVQDHVFSF